jgi:hypothetical protein
MMLPERLGPEASPSAGFGQPIGQTGRNEGGRDNHLDYDATIANHAAAGPARMPLRDLFADPWVVCFPSSGIAVLSVVSG